MRARGAETYIERLERVTLNPLKQTTNAHRAFVIFLLAVIAWGFYAYVVQLRYGLLSTGMGNQVSWGFYILNFVFFIGISHVGALISAILRLTNAGWRTPIARIGELITISALIIGAMMIIIDLGRPDRMMNLITFGRFQSPLVWDVIGVVTYLVGSVTYLYIPAIPDLALMRDRLDRGASGLKRSLITLFALGWQGTPEQHRRLNKANRLVTVMIIPIAISVHTVVSFVFAATLRPGWDSTILASNFVIGALFSGIGGVVVVMALFRRFYHLEEYLTEKHFKYMSYLLMVLLFSYFYFVLTEYLTVGYKLRVEENHLLSLLLAGKNATWFWTFVIVGMVIPAMLILIQKGPTIPRVALAGVLVNVGMWIKRFVIIIPTQQVPMMPFEFGTYSPTWVEWSIMAAGFAGFALIITMAAKVLPIVPTAELVEEAEHEQETGGAP
jgi:molybdopterin-containing oxidoreductase family membrane subunit